MLQKEIINGLSDLVIDNNRDRQLTDEPTLAGTLAATCENLGQTLRLLADEVEKLNSLQTDNIVDDADELWDKLQPKIEELNNLQTDNIIDESDELWDKLQPKIEELVKETIRDADVDLDLDISVDSISFRV